MPVTVPSAGERFRLFRTTTNMSESIIIRSTKNHCKTQKHRAVVCSPSLAFMLFVTEWINHEKFVQLPLNCRTPPQPPILRTHAAGISLFGSCHSTLLAAHNERENRMVFILIHYIFMFIDRTYSSSKLLCRCLWIKGIKNVSANREKSLLLFLCWKQTFLIRKINGIARRFSAAELNSSHRRWNCGLGRHPWEQNNSQPVRIPLIYHRNACFD